MGINNDECDFGACEKMKDWKLVVSDVRLIEVREEREGERDHDKVEAKIVYFTLK